MKAYKYHSTLPSYQSNPFLGGYRTNIIKEALPNENLVPLPEWFAQILLPYTAKIGCKQLFPREAFAMFIPANSHALCMTLTPVD